VTLAPFPLLHRSHDAKLLPSTAYPRFGASSVCFHCRLVGVFAFPYLVVRGRRLLPQLFGQRNRVGFVGLRFAFPWLPRPERFFRSPPLLVMFSRLFSSFVPSCHSLTGSPFLRLVWGSIRRPLFPTSVPCSCHYNSAPSS